MTQQIAHVTNTESEDGYADIRQISLLLRQAQVYTGLSDRP